MSDCLHCDINQLVQGRLERGEADVGELASMMVEALVKARCRASTALSRQGPFGLKIAALASRSETLRRRSSRYRLPRVFHGTQTTHRSRRLIQPSSEANSRHWLKPK